MEPEDRAERIVADWRERREEGEDLDGDDLLREHPELASEIGDVLAAQSLLEQAWAESDSPSEIAAPERVGEYRIVREIGRGGMGVVYEAEQTSMGRRVALKVLSPAVTHVHQAVQRFRREARAAGQLHHTNIVPVHAMGEDKGLWFYAMELVEGETLAEVIATMHERRDARRAGRSPSEGEDRLGLSTADGAGFARLAEAVAGVAEALEAAHQEGVIHRDVKPTNLLLTRDGTLKIVDFGLARLTGEGASMTMTGQIVGTPHYMSPEQAMARQIPLDHRTDVYSLGATLYEVLTLRTPFQGDSLQQICSQIISRDPVPIRRANPRVPRDLETIVAKAMEKDPARRYATADEMARDLRRFVEGMPIKARRIGPVARAWRKVKRNKIRTALVTSVVLLAATGSLVALLASRETERRTTLEYAALCAEAAEAVPHTVDPDGHSEFGCGLPSGEAPAELYTRAIDLLPGRWEAFLGRALVPGRSLEDRLADVDAARARGLGERTWRLGRAYLEGSRKEFRSGDADTSADAYFLGTLEAMAGRTSEALRLLGRAVQGSESRDLVHFLARRSRARLWAETGNPAGALEELHAIQALGDDGLPVRVRLAVTWRRMRNDEEAETRFESILGEARNGDRGEAWVALCRACRDEPAWHDRASAKAFERCPDDAGVVAERILALRRRAEFAEVLELARRLQALAPESRLGRWEVAHALHHLGRFDESLSAYDRAIEEEPGNGDLHESRGRALGDGGRFADALVAFGEATKLAPRRAGVHACRALALVKLNRPEEALDAYAKAIELDPLLLRAHHHRWDLLRRLGREDEAREEMARAASSSPDTADGHRLRATALRKLERLEDALTEFGEALRLRPGDEALLEERGDILLRLGRPEEANDVLDELVARHRSHRAYEGRAKVLLVRGRYEEALRDAMRAVEMNPVCATARIDLGIALWRLERHEEALAAFDAVLEIRDEDPKAWTNRGVVLAELGRYEEARDSHRKAIERGPRNVMARVNLGALLIDHLGRVEEAVEVLEKALELDPENADAHGNLGIALKRLERFDEALPVIEKACALDPERSGFWETRGFCLSRLGRYADAETALRKALALDDASSYAWHALGNTLGHQDRDAEAVEALDHAIGLDPGTWRMYYDRGQSLLCLEKRGEAVRDFRKAIELEPSALEAHLWLADTLAAMGEPEEAVKAYDAAIAVDPDDPRAHHDRGAVLMNSRRFDEARASLSKATELAPDHALAHVNLGRAHAELGDHEKAAAAYARGLELEPGYVKGRWWRVLSLVKLRKVQQVADECSRIVEQDPKMARAHIFRGWALRSLGRLDEAVKAYRAGLALKPGSGGARWELARALEGLWRLEEALNEEEWLCRAKPEEEDFHAERAFLLAHLGRFEEAETALRRAEEIAPRSKFVLSRRALVLTVLGRFPEAIDAAKTLHAKAPREHDDLLVHCLRAAGRAGEARRVASEAVEKAPAEADGPAFAHLCAVAGERERAVRILDGTAGPWTPGAAYTRACTHALLGNADEALRWLERALEAGFRRPANAPRDPDLAGLEKDPRYQELRERLIRKE